MRQWGRGILWNLLPGNTRISVLLSLQHRSLVPTTTGVYVALMMWEKKCVRRCVREDLFSFLADCELRRKNEVTWGSIWLHVDTFRTQNITYSPKTAEHFRQCICFVRICLEHAYKGWNGRSMSINASGKHSGIFLLLKQSRTCDYNI